MLNYTNPMAMLCRALKRETNILVTGLCHSVQGTAACWPDGSGRRKMIDCVPASITRFVSEVLLKGEDVIR